MNIKYGQELDFWIRYATRFDIEAVKTLLDCNKKTFGFIPIPAVKNSIRKGELLVVTNMPMSSNDLYGFCRYHNRLDKQTTVYELFVCKMYRRRGIATQMLNCLNDPVVAKCPIDLESNRFYSARGFELVVIEEGKQRKLNVWRRGK